jgi:membrane protein
MSEAPDNKRENRFRHLWRVMWSYWTDEAVLIYRRSAAGKKRAQLRAVETFLFIREVLREFYRVQATTRAASLAYTTLLSLIPLLVAFSYVIRRYFARISPDFRSQLDNFLNVIVPYRTAEFSYHINRFLANAEAASTFGAIVFLLIAFRLFMAVEATINQIWKATTFRGYRQKLRAFTMLLFWGPILIGLSFTTTASIRQYPYLRIATENSFVLELVTIAILIVAFTMLFWLVPSTRVMFKSALVGAVVTAVLFELMRAGFSLYADILFSGRLNVIYGTLGLMVIFLLALEVAWLIILFGVEVSYVHQNFPGILRATEQQLEEGARYDLYFGMRALLEISRRFLDGEAGPSSYRLAEQFGATDRQMEAVLKKLESKGLVKQIGGDWSGYVPGSDPLRITFDDVMRVIEGRSRDIPPGAEDSAETPVIEALFAKLDESTHAAIGGVTIGRLVREIYLPPAPADKGAVSFRRR